MFIPPPGGVPEAVPVLLPVFSLLLPARYEPKAGRADGRAKDDAGNLAAAGGGSHPVVYY